MSIIIFTVFKTKSAFFMRLAASLPSEWRVLFVTTRYHSYLLIEAAGYQVKMLQEYVVEPLGDVEGNQALRDAMEMDVAGGYLGPSTAVRQCAILLSAFRQLFTREPCDRLLLWNGSRLQGAVCTLVAKELGVRRLHFEVGNLPGKLFVDPEGVNARSSLMARDLRSEGAIDVEKTRAYLNSHRARKEQAHLVPQRRRTVRNWSLLLDYAYNCTHPYALVEDEISPMVKGARKLVGIGTQLYFRDYDAIDMQRPFFMVPMQVEADSQLLLNSSVSMYECVCEALHDAEARGVHLVVKPHPAEEAEVTLRRIAALRRAHPLLKISNKNTYRLIKHALKVYTVNSTVGIEALMYYKHVKVFGESFYSRYCEPDLDVPVDTAGVEHFLSRYIFDVLVDGDFFGSDIVALPQRFWEQ